MSRILSGFIPVYSRLLFSRSLPSGLPVVGGVATCIGLSAAIEEARAIPLMVNPGPSSLVGSSLGVRPSSVNVTPLALSVGGGGGGGGGGCCCGICSLRSFLLAESSVSAPSLVSCSSRLLLSDEGLSFGSTLIGDALLSSPFAGVCRTYSSLTFDGLRAEAGGDAFGVVPSLGWTVFSVLRLSWSFFLITAFSKNAVTYWVIFFLVLGSMLDGSETRLFLKSDSTSFFAILK